MRGVFTAGVLDAFLDYEVEFDYVIGASAGAAIGINYFSGQRGRSRYIDLDMHRIHPYIGLKGLFNGHGVIDLDFVFNDLPKTYYPFDFERYQEATRGRRMIMVATDAVTGEAAYLEEYEDFGRFADACRASCSLPLFCPLWKVDGRPMADGGLADSVPFKKAFADGCDRLVVVMTKDETYRKCEHRMWLPSAVYSDFPKVRELLCRRGPDYNKQIEELRQAEKEGNVIVVRPSQLFGVGRTTTDANLLELLYADGLRAGRDVVKALAQGA